MKVPKPIRLEWHPRGFKEYCTLIKQRGSDCYEFDPTDPDIDESGSTKIEDYLVRFQRLGRNMLNWGPEHCKLVGNDKDIIELKPGDIRIYCGYVPNCDYYLVLSVQKKPAKNKQSNQINTAQKRLDRYIAEIDQKIRKCQSDDQDVEDCEEPI